MQGSSAGHHAEAMAARTKGTSRRQLRSSSFTIKILGLLFILCALSIVYNNILGLRAHRNDTAAKNYQVTFDAPIPDRIHSQDNINVADRDGTKTQFLDNSETITTHSVTATPWDSSKSAVLGLASGLSYNIYERKCRRVLVFLGCLIFLSLIEYLYRVCGVTACHRLLWPYHTRRWPKPYNKSH